MGQNYVDGGNVPCNKQEHYPFRKSQLDSRTFDIVGSMGLWPRYYSKKDLNVLSSIKKRVQTGFILLQTPRKRFKYILTLFQYILMQQKNLCGQVNRNTRKNAKDSAFTTCQMTSKIPYHNAKILPLLSKLIY